MSHGLCVQPVHKYRALFDLLSLVESRIASTWPAKISKAYSSPSLKSSSALVPQFSPGLGTLSIWAVTRQQDAIAIKHHSWSAWQMFLAVAVLGLSASLVNEKFCNSKAHYCVFALTKLWGPYHAYGTTRYCTFLGIYGILTAAVGTASLLFDSIPTILPLVGDSIGAMFYLAGGIAWVVDLAKLTYSCNDYKKVYSGQWIADSVVSTCKRCEADHGLVWALFAFTAGLAICDFLRRRDLVQSSK